MSVACDDGSFSSPKSSHEGVAFPLRPANTFPNEVRSVNNTDLFTTRYACNAPASSRHPRLRRARHCTPLSQHGSTFSRPSKGFVRYKQRGILQSAHYKHSRNIAYIELTLSLLEFYRTTRRKRILNLLRKRVNRRRKQVNIFRVDVHLFSTR